MSYAFGYDLPIKTPVGTTKVSIPLEAMAKDLAQMAATQAYPILRDQVISDLYPTLEKKIVNELAPKLIAKAKPEVRSELATAMTDVRKTVFLASGIIVASVVIASLWVSSRRRTS